MKLRYIIPLPGFFLIALLTLIFNPSPVKADVYVLLYENGKKVTDNSVAASSEISRNSICDNGCCYVDTGFKYVNEETRRRPEPELFSKMFVRNVPSFDEWNNQYLLGIEGCEDRVTKSKEDMETALRQWHTDPEAWRKGKSQEEIIKAEHDYLVSQGFTSVGYPEERCFKQGDKKYISYISKFITHPKYTVNIDLPYPDKSPDKLYPINSLEYPWPEYNALNNLNLVKVDIAKGTTELVTLEMRKEMEKMIQTYHEVMDIDSLYVEVMDRMCREDFLEDQSPTSSPSNQQPNQPHSAAPASTTGLKQPYMALIAGAIVAVFLVGTLLVVYWEKGFPKKGR